MFDKNNSRTIDFNEFAELFAFVTGWVKVILNNNNNIFHHSLMKIFLHRHFNQRMLMNLVRLHSPN